MCCNVLIAKLGFRFCELVFLLTSLPFFLCVYKKILGCAWGGHFGGEGLFFFSIFS